MNQMRLRPDLRLEGSGALEPPVVPFEEFKAKLGLYVLAPEITGDEADRRLRAHQRQVDFLDGDDGVASAERAAEPQQVELNRAQLDGHMMAVRVLTDLTMGGEAEIIPFPVSLPEQPLAQMTA
jgi:hypothetical protein